MRKVREAAACYRRALQLKPDYAETHSNLGNALKGQGKLDEALSCCRRTLELKPEFARAHNNLGSVLEELGDLQGAEGFFRAALRHNFRSALAHYNLAALLGGKLPEADVVVQRQLLDEMGLRDKRRLLLHFGLDRVLDSRGEYLEAAEHLARGNAMELSEWRKRGQAGAHVPRDRRNGVRTVERGRVGCAARRSARNTRQAAAVVGPIAAGAPYCVPPVPIHVAESENVAALATTMSRLPGSALVESWWYPLKASVVLALVLSPPLRFKVLNPAARAAPGAMVWAALPACTRPATEPPAGPEASVPPLMLNLSPRMNPPPLALASFHVGGTRYTTIGRTGNSARPGVPRSRDRPRSCPCLRCRTSGSPRRRCDRQSRRPYYYSQTRPEVHSGLPGAFGPGGCGRGLYPTP